MTNYQLLPPLRPNERVALRDSIATFGVLHPVIVDEDGAVIPGHHPRLVLLDALLRLLSCASFALPRPSVLALALRPPRCAV